MKIGPILTMIFSMLGTIISAFAAHALNAQDARFTTIEGRLGNIETVLMRGR